MSSFRLFTRYFLQREAVFLKSHRPISISAEGICVANEEVKAFIMRSMVAVGTKPDHATHLANNLTMADHRGHFSHGLNRLEMYIKDIKSGITVSNTEPHVLSENAGTAYVDGNNLLGPVVGVFCMQTAMKKAREAGVGLVVAKGSNHFGIAGFYSLMASDQGLLGMTFTNTSPLTFPTRGKELMLGTNPICLAAPAINKDSFVIDMATSSVALGKVELSAVKKEPIPLGWGADGKGHPTTDPAIVRSEGGLMPLGGAEVTSGYKGYGLAMMVEVLCGVLGGAKFGKDIRKWKLTDTIANLGQCYIAINPSSFSPNFSNDLQKYLDSLRQSEVAEGETKVIVAGDPEREHMEKCSKEGGITYHANVIHLLDTMADELEVERVVRKS